MSNKSYNLNFYIQNKVQKGTVQDQGQIANALGEASASQDRKTSQQIPQLVQTLCFFQQLSPNVVQILPKVLEATNDSETQRVLYYLFGVVYGPGTAGTPQLQFYLGYADDILKQIQMEKLRRSWSDSLSIQNPYLNIKYALRNIAYLARSNTDKGQDSPYPQELKSILQRLFQDYQTQISAIFKPQQKGLGLGLFQNKGAKQEGLLEVLRTMAQVARCTLKDKLLGSVVHHILDLALKSSDLLIMQHGIGTAVEMLNSKVAQESVTSWFVNFASKFAQDYEQIQQQPGTLILRQQVAAACGAFVYGPEIRGSFSQQYYPIWYLLGIQVQQDNAAAVNLEAVKSLLGGQIMVNFSFIQETLDFDKTPRILTRYAKAWENLIKFMQLSKKEDYLGSIAKIIEKLSVNMIQVLRTGLVSSSMAIQINALQSTGRLFRARIAFMQVKKSGYKETPEFLNAIEQLRKSLVQSIANIYSGNLKVRGEASVAAILAMNEESNEIIAEADQLAVLNSIEWEKGGENLSYEQFNQWPQYVFQNICDFVLLRNSCFDYLLDCGLQVCIQNPQHIFPQEFVKLWDLTLGKYNHLKEKQEETPNHPDLQYNMLFQVVFQALVVVDGCPLSENEGYAQSMKLKILNWESYQIEAVRKLQQWVGVYASEFKGFASAKQKPGSLGATYSADLFQDQVANATEQEIDDIKTKGVAKFAFQNNPLIFKIASVTYNSAIQAGSNILIAEAAKLICTCAFMSEEPLRIFCYSLLRNLQKIRPAKDIYERHVGILDLVYSSQGVFVSLLKQYGTKKDAWPTNKLLKFQERHKYLQQRVLEAIGPFNQNLEGDLLPFGPKSKGLLNLNAQKVRQSDFVRRLTNRSSDFELSSTQLSAPLQAPKDQQYQQPAQQLQQPASYEDLDDFALNFGGGQKEQRQPSQQLPDRTPQAEPQLVLVEPNLVDGHLDGVQESEIKDPNMDFGIFGGGDQNKQDSQNRDPDASQGNLMVSGDNFIAQSQLQQQLSENRNDSDSLLSPNKLDLEYRTSSANERFESVRHDPINVSDPQQEARFDQSADFDQPVFSYGQNQVSQDSEYQMSGANSGALANKGAQGINKEGQGDKQKEGEVGRDSGGDIAIENGANEIDVSSQSSLASIEIQDINDRTQDTEEQPTQQTPAPTPTPAPPRELTDQEKQQLQIEEAKRRQRQEEQEYLQAEQRRKQAALEKKMEQQRLQQQKQQEEQKRQEELRRAEEQKQLEEQKLQEQKQQDPEYMDLMSLAFGGAKPKPKL